MHILIVDNNMDQQCWGAEDLRRYARIKTGAQITVRRGPHLDLPLDRLDQYDRVIVSGSRASCLDTATWIDKLDAALKFWIDAKIPLLGVCFGHQAIARVLGGRQSLGKSKVPEIGWTQIDRVDESPLFSGLPKQFYSFSSHYEEVVQLPPGARNLARSKDCAIQAFDLPGRPIFAIQFHPEKTDQDAKASFKSHLDSKKPVRLMGLKNTDRLYNPDIALKIFSNFLSN